MTDPLETTQYRSSEGYSDAPNLNIALGGSTLIAPGRGDVHLNYHSGLLSAHPLGEWRIQQARTDFVRPQGYGRIIGRLAEQHVVVLLGKHKTGRKTGAINLLHDVGGLVHAERPILALLRLRPTWLQPHVEALPGAAQTSYLLDLSDSLDKIDQSSNTDMRPDGQFGAGLEQFALTLQQKGSFLVIVTTPDVWEKCTISAQSLTIDWRSPRASSIAAARLYGNPQRSERTAWLSAEPFSSEIADATVTPSDAVRLADAIARAEDTETTTAQDAALDEFRRWEKYLRTWFRENTDVYDRVIFIAAAVLKKARDQDVIDAADQLLRAANEENLVLKPLRAPDLVERLANTGAEIDSRHMVSLNERRPGLDEAVMDWVWDQRPKLRDSLLRWLVGLAIEKRTGPGNRNRIARVIAGLSIRRATGASLLMQFAQIQAKEGGAHRELAVRIIDEAVLDPGIGTAIRNTLLDWSSVKDPVRLDLVAAVCGEKLGIERTDLALKRLGKILANNDATPEVIQAAGRSLGSLAARRDLRPVVLDAIVELLNNDPRTGARAFLELARLGESSVVPGLLADAETNADLRNTLARAWLDTHKSAGTDRCAPVMCAWVEAIGDGLPEEVVLSVCLPTLRAAASRGLDARVVQAASTSVAERILDNLYNHKQGQAGADT